MATHLLITALLLFSSLLGPVLGGVLLSTLPQTLSVQASPRPGEILKAGEDKITLRWGLNQNFQGIITDDAYKIVKVKLCFAPISQQDRPWRRTVDDLIKDKTCQFDIVCRPYSKNNKEETFKWIIEKDIPTATYFVRAYALNSTEKEVGFGQTSNEHKTINLFEIQVNSVRLALANIVAACMTAFCVVSVCVFCILEKRRLRRARLLQRNESSSSTTTASTSTTST
ncbi:hypothetical protein BVC80_1065g133 [Macleaya cordata]|uniref:High-affinity nitrate transporter n=1 Tax=Macleaya cordata TaxID=56857 RepID=A0A200RCY0_MACCD|nr:hypothetical protein BVC80_1065g133 [Macleaya cordata]